METDLRNRDLKRFSESTRRRLYEMLVDSIFGANRDGECTDLLDLTPDDVQLEVFWLHRRWLANYVLPKTKTKRIRGESRWILLRLYLDESGKLMQDEV